VSQVLPITPLAVYAILVYCLYLQFLQYSTIFVEWWSLGTLSKSSIIHLISDIEFEFWNEKLKSNESEAELCDLIYCSKSSFKNHQQNFRNFWRTEILLSIPVSNYIIIVQISFNNNLAAYLSVWERYHWNLGSK